MYHHSHEKIKVMINSLIAPVAKVSSFPHHSTVVFNISRAYKSLPKNIGGSRIGAATESVIDSGKASDAQWDQWIEYVYECSAYWAELNKIDD